MALSQTGDIMGVILNNIMHRDDVEEEDDDDDGTCNKNSKFKEIVVLLDKIKREANVFTHYPTVDRIMEIKIVTVNEEYRGQGVCKALVDKTKYSTNKLTNKHDNFIITIIFFSVTKTTVVLDYIYVDADQFL